MAPSLVSCVTLDKSPRFSKHQFIHDSNSTWPHKAILSIKELTCRKCVAMSLGFNSSFINVRKKKKMLLMMILLMAMVPWCVECTK